MRSVVASSSSSTSSSTSSDEEEPRGLPVGLMSDGQGSAASESNNFKSTECYKGNISDIPASGTDTEITNFSWTPKGVVVHGNQSLNLEKRLKLEISYTEIN